MLTHRHKDNGGGYAAPGSFLAPRRIRGPLLQPQGSLTRSLSRRPTAALDPGASTAPNRRTPRGQATAPAPTHARREQNPPNHKITLTEVSTVSGDCHFNTHRPHRSLGQAAPLRALPQPDTTDITVIRRDRLGGAIHEYRQVA